MLSSTEKQRRIRAILSVLRGGFYSPLDISKALNTSKPFVEEIISRINREGKILFSRSVKSGKIFYLQKDRADIASIVVFERDYKRRIVSDSSHALFNTKILIKSVLPDKFGRYPFVREDDKNGAIYNIALRFTSPQNNPYLMI